MATIRHTRILVGLLCLLLLLAACGEEDPGDATADDDGDAAESDDDDDGDGGGGDDDGELVEVSVGQLTIAATVPIYLADREGFFAEEGIEVQFEEFAGGAEILPAFSSGAVDAAFSNHVSTVSAVQEGLDFVCVTGSDNSPAEPPDTGNILVAADSDVTELTDLEGRTVGVNNVDSILSLFFTALLSDAGVDVDSIEFVEVPFPNMGDALGGDQVDAVGNIEPFNTLLQQQGVAEVLSPLYHPVRSNTELGCYGFTQEFIDDRPEVVEGFVRAHERGKELAASDHDLTLEAIGEWTEMDSDLVEEIVWSDWQPGASEEDLQAIADLMFEHGFIDEEFDAATAVTQEFLD